ncbi:uncharacterized protein MYCGRDRAFT_97998 [Zymoseptoria tritici IPO323]|uniref:Uncharacterized protein n=1 Tax=Zymoseptoria tritici (strain CBS 115943 / IPO323) TaxID=336722 RepID=F9XS08_ZYMTI|nr:uncharacterized protein MYCGRDRAFT_97998 [Zymoseptoria tritici IPO323]EGP81888.1 hypothetical protein MYCGRDRAFT_97998 [Zymoseptoria tritici IPO323]
MDKDNLLKRLQDYPYKWLNALDNAEIRHEKETERIVVVCWNAAVEDDGACRERLDSKDISAGVSTFRHESHSRKDTPYAEKFARNMRQSENTGHTPAAVPRRTRVTFIEPAPAAQSPVVLSSADDSSDDNFRVRRSRRRHNPHKAPPRKGEGQ